MDLNRDDKPEVKIKKGSQEMVLADLEARCAELGIRVIYDDLRSEGGVCRVKNRLMVIINRRASVATKIRIIDEALKRAGENIASPMAEKMKPPAIQPQEQKGTPSA